MRTPIAFFLGVAICGTLIVVTSRDHSTVVAAPTSTATIAPPVKLADVRERGMTGDLGEPMGKIVPIRGTIVDGKTLRFKDAEGRTYADVHQVDGHRLNPAVRLEVRSHPFAEVPFNPPPAGTVVSLKGYETGEFTGIVTGFNRPSADVGYFFRNYFVVLR